MNVLSLFDGISCGMLALKRADIQVDNYYASEIEEHAMNVSKYNFPEIIQLGDINNFEKWNLPKIDLLIGGSPCQDLSIATPNRTGLNGNRSSLFYKYVECLHKFKPKYFLLENNYSMKKDDRDMISHTLGVEPIMINSSLVSAQNRKRLYWTNIPNIILPSDKKIVLKDIIESGSVDRDKSLCIARRYAGFNGSQEYLRHRYYDKSFGQAVIENGMLRQLTHIECERLQTLPDNYTKYEGDNILTPKIVRYEMIGNGWTVDIISHILRNISKSC